MKCLVSLLCVLSWVSAASGQTPATTTSAIVESGVRLWPVEKELLDATNAARQRNGCGPLVLDASLQQSARLQSWRMVQTGSMRHGLSGASCAENIAMGQSSVTEVIRTWLNSSGHRRNMLNRGSARCGVAVYQSSGGTLGWTQQFR